LVRNEGEGASKTPNERKKKKKEKREKRGERKPEKPHFKREPLKGEKGGFLEKNEEKSKKRREGVGCSLLPMVGIVEGKIRTVGKEGGGGNKMPGTGKNVGKIFTSGQSENGGGCARAN